MRKSNVLIRLFLVGLIVSQVSAHEFEQRIEKNFKVKKGGRIERQKREKILAERAARKEERLANRAAKKAAAKSAEEAAKTALRRKKLKKDTQTMLEKQAEQMTK